MKLYISLIVLLFLLIFSVSSYLFWKADSDINLNVKNDIGWITKEKETINRFSSVPILLYHDIDGKGNYSLSLSTIRSHFQYIKDNNIKVIPLSGLIERLSGSGPFSDKVIVISFDDGFLSMYTKLLPLIREFNYPVTLFVYTNNIFVEAKKNMTWEKLKTLEKNGIQVECHSMTHEDLSEIKDTDSKTRERNLFKDIYLSKRIIELYLEKKVKYFAFPYGRYNEELIGLCRLAGYERTFSTDYREHVISRDNYCLGRGHIKNNYSFEMIRDIVK